MSLPAPKRTPQQPQQQAEFGNEFVFRPATKENMKARVAIQGVSGSGKTWTSLALAHGLGERFAVIDTERGAASKYVGIRGIQFDVLQMTNFDPRRLVKALAAAASAGYGTVLIDSLSHFWSGVDGTLQQVDKAKSRFGGNSFSGWQDGTPMQNDMVDALLAYPGHVIATMRSHTEWVLQKNDKGKTEPVAMGMRAEQRKGVEYEFDVVASMDRDNVLTVLKSRVPKLNRAVIREPDGMALAADLLAWLADGAPAADPADFINRATAEDATYEGLLALYGEVEAASLLASPMLHPETGEPTNLGDVIKARGSALRTVPAGTGADQ